MVPHATLSLRIKERCLSSYASAAPAPPPPAALLAPGRPTHPHPAQPDREWTLTELADRVGSSVATSQREVTRAEQAGVVTSRRLGNTRLVTAVPGPLTEPLTELLLRSFGPRQVIAEELAPAAGSEQAYLFGSWAARYAGQPGRPQPISTSSSLAPPTGMTSTTPPNAPPPAWPARSTSPSAPSPGDARAPTGSTPRSLPGPNPSPASAAGRRDPSGRVTR
jgi:hypothetical protein